MFASMLTFNFRSKATNIGDCLFRGAVFGCRREIRTYVGGFGDSPEDFEFLRDEILKIYAPVIVIIL